MNDIVLAPSRLPIAPAIAREYDLSPANWRVLVESIFPAAKSVEAVLMALAYCKARNLDIMKRPVHIVPMWDQKKRGYVETVWEGIASIRTTASRTKAYAGIDAVEYGPTITRTFKGERDVWENQRKTGTEPVEKTVTYPEWASVIVWRLVGDTRCPFHAKVFWLESYASMGKMEVPNEMWSKRPFGQIDKCVEAAGLRKAFPEEIGNTMSADEMEGHTIDVSLAHESQQLLDPPKPPAPPAKQIENQPAETKQPPKPRAKKADAVKATIEEKNERISPVRTDKEQNAVDREIGNIGTQFEREVNEEVDRVEQGERGQGEPGAGVGEAEEPTPGELLSQLDDALATAKTAVDVQTIYDDYDLEARLESVQNGEQFVGVAIGIKRRHQKRVAN
jgi:phage recombination protein Bet